MTEGAAVSPFLLAKTCKFIGPKRITEELSTICEVDGRRAIVHGVPLLAPILTRKLIAARRSRSQVTHRRQPGAE